MKHINTVIALLLIILLLIPAGVTNGQAEDALARYMIQPGDTLISIAVKFNVSLEDLIQANDIDDQDFISPGQIIVIPGLIGIAGIITPITLDIGESLQSISTRYESAQTTIEKLNRITASNMLVAGSTLLVPINPDQPMKKEINFFPEMLTFLELSVLSKNSLESLEILNQLPSNLEIIDYQKILIPIEDKGSESVFPSILDLEITLFPLPLQQGTTASLKIVSMPSIEVSGIFEGNELTFFKSGSTDYFALQGIHALAEPGITDFELSFRLSDGSEPHLSQSVLIDAGNYETDPPLIVDPETIDPEKTKPEEDFVKQITSMYTAEKLWNGKFSSPAVYQEYTSLFGNRRTYNGSTEISFHSGLDFGGGVTLPISAPADGKVVFAGFLPIRGNAVFIDHGLGVFTAYFHQSLLTVSEGDFVNKGQKIGEVGNTGRVSNATDYPGAGAHLHWEVWVNGIQVDPLNWLYYEYPH